MSIFDDLLGRSSADASNRAAQDTYGKLMSASSDLKGYGDQYASSFSDLAKQFSQYGDAGKAALQRLMGGLGLGGAGDQQAFTDSYRALPGYQAALETGRGALTGALNAGNMLQSGKALKQLTRYGQDYEDQKSGSYLDRLTGLASQGQQATAQGVATEGQGLQGQLASRQSAFQGETAAAPVIGQGMVAGETAKQGALTNLMNLGGYLAGTAMGGWKMPTTAAKPTAPTQTLFTNPWNSWAR